MNGLAEQLQAALGSRYRVERVAAAGGMSTVVRAVDLKHDRIVAVKVLHADVADHLGTDRFLDEIRTVARLQHPHIVPLFDSGSANGLLYYIMPYIEGESLRERLARTGPLSVDVALGMARQLCDALAHAHDQGIIHRDVKPDNILLAGDQALLSDFGIARAIHVASRTRVTGTGIVIGTPAYMSPEQASGERELDGRSDLYSLGCVVYEMLAGTPPHTGPNAQQLIAARLHSTPRPIRTHRSEVPVRVEQALVRVLATLPEERHADARALGREFAVSGQQDVVVRTALGRRARAIGWGAGLALAVLAILLASRLAATSPHLDPTLYVVLPFAHDRPSDSARRSSAGGEGRDTATGSMRGDDGARLVYDAIARWDGVHLVDEMRARDAVAADGGEVRSLDHAGRIARRLRAGRLVWGSVVATAAGPELRATVYDATASPPRALARRVTVIAASGDVVWRVAAMVDSLVVHSSLERGTPPEFGSRNVAAMQALMAGRAEMARWAVERALDHFVRASALDTAYAYAQLWAAQAALWLPVRRDLLAASHAEAALAHGLAPPLRPWARATLHLARGEMPQACATYDAMIAADSGSFVGWHGRGECLSRDALVVEDDTSPSGWRFRSSRHAAVEAYRRALSLVPSFQEVFGTAAMVRLEELLLAAPNAVVRGFALAPDTVQFLAFPGLERDTLSVVPWTIAALQALAPGAFPASWRAALDRNRKVILQLTERWAGDAPTHLPAQVAFAHALENVSRLDSSTGTPSALSQLHRARALASDRASVRHLDLDRVRLHLKRSAWGEAKALADSVLADADSVALADVPALVSLALLTGRVGTAPVLGRRVSDRDSVMTARGIFPVPPAVSADARALLAYAASGASPDSVSRYLLRVRAGIEQFVVPADAPLFTEALLKLPLVLAYPVSGALPELATWSDPYVAAERAHARGDMAGVRATLRMLDSSTAGQQAGDDNAAVAHLDVWLRRAAGDSAGALAYATRYLAALPATTRQLWDFPGDGVGIVRLLQLHAELAWHSGDRENARRSADAVFTLWRDHDATLAEPVGRLRKLASAER